MTIKSINGDLLKKMVLNGAKLLDSNKQHVDSLNVFPVPDGDTGTNMSLTMISAAKEVSACGDDIRSICKAMAKGALHGARGNSGVITSQIFKGITTELEKCESEITVKDFSVALAKGKEVAYNAVVKPMEGTILTVVRVMSEQSEKFARRTNNVVDYFAWLLKAGEDILKQTPEMLPALKKAGVVDAGGRGLLLIFQGFYNCLVGKDEVNIEFDDKISVVKSGKNNYEQFHVNLDALDDIKFAYCTEFFVINLKPDVDEKAVDVFRNKLIEIGDCVLVISDSTLVKVHVHTNNPGQALSYALELGELDHIKIENMLEQNRALSVREDEELKPVGMVSVCSGDGMSDIFKDLGVDEIIQGGQTMNPSAEDIASACDKVLAENVFVFPNNKNIILAAEQAKEISVRKVHVVPTVSVPQGISAVLAYDTEATVEDNLTSMDEMRKCVKTGDVTFAVRKTSIDGFDLEEGDIIGLGEKKILAVGDNPESVAEDLVSKLIDDDISVITLYYGYNTSEGKADSLKIKLAEKYKSCDVDAHYGGQALYYYIIAME